SRPRTGIGTPPSPLIRSSSGSTSTRMRAGETARSARRTSRRSAASGRRRMPSRFIEALLGAHLPVIMEVKRQDGNGVALMGERTVPAIVAEYVAAGAPCISVVTGRWFGGSDEMLREAAGLTDLPLLQKDFLTRETQIVAAKELGASAVLLTAQLLPKSALPKLIEITLGQG